MRAFCLGLVLAALAGSHASAACRCVCFNGQLRSQCSGPLDPPAICSRVCPLPVNPPGGRAQLLGLPQVGSSDSTTAAGSPAADISLGGLGR